MINSPRWAALIDVKIADGVIEAVSNARLVPYGLTSTIVASPATEPAGALGTALAAALAPAPLAGGIVADEIEPPPPQSDQDRIDVVARHGRNITLCEALYPSLHILEVVIRNRLNDEFRQHFGALNWYDQSWLTTGHQKLVTDAKSELLRKNKRVEPDRVVAELGFGFWCGMFSGNYQTSTGPWPSLLTSVLPNVPRRHRMRNQIRDRLEDARALRNRVFHHEAIMHFPDLPAKHRSLAELVGWMSLPAREHIEHICRFNAVFADTIK